MRKFRDIFSLDCGIVNPDWSQHRICKSRICRLMTNYGKISIGQKQNKIFQFMYKNILLRKTKKTFPASSRTEPPLDRCADFRHCVRNRAARGRCRNVESEGNSEVKGKMVLVDRSAGCWCSCSLFIWVRIKIGVQRCRGWGLVLNLKSIKILNEHQR